MIERDSGDLRIEGAVEELTPDMVGRWIVQTQGTLHVFDLSDGTYERRQHDGLNPMRRDREAIPLPMDNVSVWPKVGQCFRLFVNVDGYPGYGGTYRTSSLIRSITPAREEE